MSNVETDNRPLFTDLFYAAVIGFAVSKIESGKDINYYYFSLTGLAFVIEDWYSYYTRVTKGIARARYDLKNITIESLILISWSICFSGIIDKSDDFLLFFGSFMGIRWLAGAGYHRRRQALFSKAGWSEHMYFISAVASFISYYLIKKFGIPFYGAFTLNAACWFVLVVANWTFYSESIAENGP